MLQSWTDSNKTGGNTHCWAYNNDEELLSFLYFYCCYNISRQASDLTEDKKKPKPTFYKYLKKLVVTYERKPEEKIKDLTSNLMGCIASVEPHFLV